MKPMRLLMLPMLVLGLGGCVLMGPSYTEPVDFDLGVPAAEGGQTGGVADPVRSVPQPVRLQPGIPGARKRRPAVFRRIQPLAAEPGAAAATANPHRTAGPGGEMGKSARLNATIYRFEFDRARHTAVLSVEFSGKAGDVTERTSQLTYETPYEGDAPEAAAKARR